MESLWFEIGVIFCLLLANGVFAMAELAVVSARKARLQNLDEEGDPRAGRALALANDPGKFLSTVQVGITLVGIIAAAYGGASIGERLGDYLKHLGETSNNTLLSTYGGIAGVAIVVVVLTFFSVVIGELAPKRLALNSPERIAMLLAGPMGLLARIAHPVVWALDKSGDLLLGLIGVKRVDEAPVSEEEMRVLLNQGMSAGVFKKAEAAMVEGVLDLDESTVADLMTPRVRIIWLSLEEKEEDNWRKVAGSGHSHFPVYSKTRDNVVGMVSVKSLWANASLVGKVELRNVLTPPLYVPSTMPAAKLFEEFKRAGKHIALVVDEFGAVQGLVSLHDLLEAIVGQMPEKEQGREPQARKRDDGTWLVDAMLETEPARAALGIPEPFPGEEDGAYRTIGGFVLRLLGHIPREGEKVIWNGFQFEIVDMDRQRIDKLIVRLPKAPPGDLAAFSSPTFTATTPPR